MREAILSAPEILFSTYGFNAVSIRDIAEEAGANPGSLTYHFKSKDGLLLEIYQRHCGPINRRRSELLAAAKRVRDLQDRLEAIVRAYVLPAFSSGSDLAGGGARFTRLRAIMSAEGNEVVDRIIAQTFDDTSHAFIDEIHESLLSSRARRLSGAAIFSWERSTTRSLRPNVSRGCREDRRTEPTPPRPLNNSCARPSLRWRLMPSIGTSLQQGEVRMQPKPIRSELRLRRGMNAKIGSP